MFATLKAAPVAGPAKVVIVGGGAAGVACAEALRAEGHTGSITMIAGEGSDPVDRPNLSKDFLAGTAPEEWVYLRSAEALAGMLNGFTRSGALTVTSRTESMFRHHLAIVAQLGTSAGTQLQAIATIWQPRRIYLLVAPAGTPFQQFTTSFTALY